VTIPRGEAVADDGVMTSTGSSAVQPIAVRGRWHRGGRHCPRIYPRHGVAWCWGRRAHSTNCHTATTSLSD